MADKDADKLVYLRSDETGWGVRIFLYARCELLHTVKPETLDWDGAAQADRDAETWIEEHGYEIYDHY